MTIGLYLNKKTKKVIHLLLSFILFDDKLYLQLIYYYHFNKRCNFDEPKSFNEKLNWLKLNDHNPLYTRLVDKYLVKEYVEKVIGIQYLIPNYGVWDSFDDIDFNHLPDKFVLKCTHDSGSTLICRDKKKFLRDYDKNRAKIKHHLSINYYSLDREWVYKNVSPRIIADKLMEESAEQTLTDYKWMCFDGIPKIMYISHKDKHIHENYYDMDFNPLDIRRGFPKHYPEYNKPDNFELMKSLSSTLSKGIPFVRVDFFDINGQVFFGEFTFYDWAGKKPFDNPEDDLNLGSWIHLPSTQ